MGALDRFLLDADRENDRSHSNRDRPERVLPFRAKSTAAGAGSAALDLVSQAAEVIKDIERKASDAEKTSYQKLDVAQRRVEALENELKSAIAFVNEAREKLREANALMQSQKSRLDEAERRMCDFEMRARTAESKAKENADSVLRVEEAIRAQILARRPLRHEPRTR
jgi:cell fate (sporulation/competence/biofilm development) regulator YmcA (YheA/YmcA/DUF963 family)